jgi:hypothetical protein
MRHPKDMEKPEVEAFLTILTNERQVSPVTHVLKTVSSSTKNSPDVLTGLSS